MVTAPSRPPRSARTLRIAGALFIVAAVIAAAAVAILQYTEALQRSTPDTYGGVFYLVPGLILLDAEPLVFAVAFVLLFAWLPRARVQLVFLLAALGYLLEVASQVLHVGPPIAGQVAVGVGTIAAGIYVVVRRMFGDGAGILFVVTMVLAQVSRLSFAFVPLRGAGILGVEYAIDVLYLACGISMIRGARTTSTATA